MRLEDIKDTYYGYLPWFTLYSMYFGYTAGLNTTSSSSIEMFNNMVSYTTYGIFIGYLYPISFPFLAGYTIYKKIKE